MRNGPGVTPPKVESTVQPDYTLAARQVGYQGTVTLQLLVKKDGTADVLRVVQGLGLGLTDSAIDALKQWKAQQILLHTQREQTFVRVAANGKEFARAHI